MQSTIRRLQDYINSFVNSRLKEAKKLFWLKAEYWDDKTLQSHIHDEVYKASCELIALHEKNPILHIISTYPDFKNVLWDSTFMNQYPRL